MKQKKKRGTCHVANTSKAHTSLLKSGTARVQVSLGTRRNHRAERGGGDRGGRQGPKVHTHSHLHTQLRILLRNPSTHTHTLFVCAHTHKPPAQRGRSTVSLYSLINYTGKLSHSLFCAFFVFFVQLP